MRVGELCRIIEMIAVHVLEYMIEENLKVKKEKRSLILAFGPGITFEVILIRNLTV